MKLNVSRGRIAEPRRVMMYGPEGIGKSTTFTYAPNPLFLDLENGTKNLYTERQTGIQSYEDLMSILDELKSNNYGYKTIIIDTVDVVEEFIIDKVCHDHNKASLADFAYGKGNVYAYEMMKKFLNKLDELISSGLYVVLLGHVNVVKFTQPDELGQYDRYSLKLLKENVNRIKQWCDDLLFVNYDTVIIKDANGNRSIAAGNDRVIYTQHRPAWDAKTRSDLPEKLPLAWSSIAPLFPETLQSPADKIREMISHLSFSISEEEVYNAIVSRHPNMKPNSEHFNLLDRIDDDFLTGTVIEYWGDFVSMLESLKR